MTTDEQQRRAAILHELLGPSVLSAMEQFRAVVRAYTRNPRSDRLQAALLDRLEDVMAEQVNHLYSVCGSLVVGPIERIRETLQATEQRLTALENTRDRAGDRE